MDLNWVDMGLLILLVSMIVVGSRKGLVRELMAFFIFAAALIVSIRFIDQVAIKVQEKLGIAGLGSALLSFLIVMGVAYAAFKLLGLIFYRVARLQALGPKDRFGGALVGALRGWLALSLLIFLTFLAPLPDVYYSEFKSSALGQTIARTLPLLYDTATPLHAADEDFAVKVENMLLMRVDRSQLTEEQISELVKSRREVYRKIYKMDSVYLGN
jgi:uncharacterized membrane protein required for colicin V production